MRITSLGFRTDVALRVLEGAEVTDRGDHLVIRTPGNPDFWWGNFLLLARVPGPGQGQEWLARFAAEFPAAQHVALGVDSTGDAETPEEFAAAGLEADRATVLTAAQLRPAGPPQHRSRDPAAGRRRRLAAVRRTGHPLLRRRRARRFPGAAGRPRGGG